MDSGKDAGMIRKYVVIGIALLISSAILVPIASGDILASGTARMDITLVTPDITVNQTFPTYQGATLTNFSAIVENGMMYTTIQIHLNFKLNNTSTQFTTLLLNVLRVYNTGNVTGNFTVTIVKTAQAGSNKTLNSTFTDALKIYMTHQYQNASLIQNSTELMNNTTTTFNFYPFDGINPMYWIGFNYTEPPYMPPSGTDQNSIQQMVNFTFKIQSAII